jgi:2-haloacid dehalogenase
MIRSVVFDLGGVLIDWNPRYLYRKLFGGDEAAMEHFLGHVCNNAWNLAQDGGRRWADAIEVLSAEHPHHRPMISAYWERWEEMLNGPLHGTVEVLAELKDKGVPIYALTNWSSETFPIAKSRYDFLGWFRDILVSGDEKLVKPDLRIYDLMLTRNGLSAGESVFIDDSLMNVDGARAAGMAGLHFQSPEKLRMDLAALGLLDSPDADG